MPVALRTYTINFEQANGHARYRLGGARGRRVSDYPRHLLGSSRRADGQVSPGGREWPNRRSRQLNAFHPVRKLPQMLVSLHSPIRAVVHAMRWLPNMPWVCPKYNFLLAERRHYLEPNDDIPSHRWIIGHQPEDKELLSGSDGQGLPCS